MKRFFIFSGALFIFSARAAQAICPVCTVAVGAGVGLSRYLGVDDTVTGVWIGGLTVSLIMWTVNWMDGKNIKFHGRKISVAFGYYLLIVAPLYYMDIIGHPFNKILGMDKLVFGVAWGSLVFFFGAMAHFYFKKKNNNQVYFPFQKVVFSISPVVVLSVVFYFITK